MANLKSSKKDVKRSAVKAVQNKAVRTELKTVVKKARQAKEEGKKADVESSLSSAYSKLDKAVSRGIIHKKQAARRKSRIAKSSQAK